MANSLGNASKAAYAVHWEFESPSKHIPYFFEDIDYPAWKEFMAINWTLPYYTSAAYIIIVLSLQKFMKNRQPLKLRRLLFLWNLGLGIFSILGFIRIIPEFLTVILTPEGIYRSLCIRDGLNKPFSFWIVAFAISKYVELGDTLFIVLRKQPLIFLQWYHHCTAMILAWIVTPYSEPITRYFTIMNLGVHSLMYSYFALKSLKVSVPRSISKCLTFLQLLQMLIAVLVNGYTVLAQQFGVPCARDPISIKWIWTIYGSYVFLFARFFYKSYFFKKTSKKM